MTHNPKHASFYTPEEEQRIQAHCQKWGLPYEELSVWEKGKMLGKDFYRDCGEEPEDDGEGQTYEQEHRLTAHDYGLK